LDFGAVIFYFGGIAVLLHQELDKVGQAGANSRYSATGTAGNRIRQSRTCHPEHRGTAVYNPLRRHITYELRKGDGTSIQDRSIIFRNSTSGFSKVKMDLMTYCIPQPGRYVFKAAGLGASRDKDAEHRLVFSKPHIASTIGYVTGITLSSVFLIGSLVFFHIAINGMTGGYVGR